MGVDELSFSSAEDEIDPLAVNTIENEISNWVDGEAWLV